jgi:hypothetical protein
LLIAPSFKPPLVQAFIARRAADDQTDAEQDEELESHGCFLLKIGVSHFDKTIRGKYFSAGLKGRSDWNAGVAPVAEAVRQ